MSTNIIRQIVLDTETTGMNKFGPHYEGHRIIEIGAVEIINRHLTDNTFHIYLKPNRMIDIEAIQIHGISDQFLKNKPTFSEIINEFLTFIRGSELIIHNAPFDLGFLNQELRICNANSKTIESYCTIIDSLKLARKKFPGQRNSLDALCERYFINNDNRRNLHSALLDARLLANVFLSMSGGQIKMKFMDITNTNISNNKISNIMGPNNTKCVNKTSLKIIYANEQEKLAHEEYLDNIQQLNKYCIWRQ
ncbi:DNA polymerase III subunit epsilon [Blochmannia endosymbiont of Camponotus sp.]|uniref:DNA polymerase III subunit epsilon n=1 Tax=Blochmannia endosymbiont of Camponotus sp. TaxID=700220 RepID=UPI0020250DA7|nr:DNA polymerase III subunit epsilon [Blochmannia endosymbiont of Camponotus sp.]URJ24136.1 DNA polymerase III subunit epsilon [Blochmannia endosymbiont of Camponotus sp.]URJ25671.1 DNA polymerase III subunit epsilon [Blochmannia endosymbiont of Camponotus sp.]